MTGRRLSSLFGLVLLLAGCGTPRPQPSSTLEAQANYWQQVGSVASTGGSVSLAQTSSGTQVIAYSEDDFINVKFWNGFTWISLGLLNTLSSAKNPSLALDSSGNPVVAWEEFIGTANGYFIYVRRFTGTSWVNVGSTGIVASGSRVSNPSLALDSSGNPVVAWEEFDGASRNIYVKRWTGTSWVQLGAALDVNTNQFAYNPSLALDSSGNPVVAWWEFDGTSNNIYVKQWTGSSWVLVGSNPLDTAVGNDSYYPHYHWSMVS
jgi:hypothetical protein